MGVAGASPAGSSSMASDTIPSGAAASVAGDVDARAPTPRVISVLAAMCIVVGSTFGIGIFTGPPTVATLVPTAGVLLALWIGSGLLSLGGAFADAELGAMMPRAGGDYVFQRAAFGPSVAFASGWMLVTGVYAAGLAFMVMALAGIQLESLLQWLSGREGAMILSSDVFSTPPLLIGDRVAVPAITLTWAQLVAAGFLLLFTMLNAWGTRQSARVQTALTLTPFALVAVFALITLLLTPEPGAAVRVAGVPASERPELSLHNLVLAYMPVFFAYSGWNVVIYVGGEVKNPGKAIPRALIAGLCAITSLYALLCLSFVHALGMDGLRAIGEKQNEAGSKTAAVFVGHHGQLGMTLLMIVALLTATNGNTLTGGRIAFAMARDGAFWSKAGRLSRRGTPATALWLQAILTIALILTGTFNQLLQICSIAMIMSGCLNTLALFALRWKSPSAARPYRATLYPWLPALYLLANVLAIGVVAQAAIFPGKGQGRDWMPLLGVGLFIAVYALHALWRRTAGGKAT